MSTLGITQAADLLRMSEDALMRKARAGIVPAARPGRNWVFLRESLLAWRDPDTPVSLEEASTILGCKVDTLRQLADRGSAPAIRSETGWLFVMAELRRYANNPERYEENNKRNARNARRRQELRPMVAEYFSWYRASKATRTPAWADREAIKEFYRLAKRLTDETGERHHVDHHIPLHGKLASGLHVQDNLRVIPALYNQSKGNRLQP